MYKKIILFASAALLFHSCAKDEKSARRFITIGTGGLTGVYYPVGGAVSKMVNEGYAQHKIRATAESTGGSVFNINAVLSGEVEFGIAQSDRQFQAWNGEAEWSAGPQKNLRVICALHPESVTLLAAEDSGIRSIRDLEGKRVNIGDPGSGNRGNAIDALKNAGLDWEKDIKAEQLKAVESANLLQDGRIDAYFYTVGHPNGSIMEATAGARKMRFIPITDTEKLISENPFYAKSIIPASMYPSAVNKEDTLTYGVKATLITSSEVPDDIAYAVTKAIFENINDFITLHPSLSLLTPENMIEGNTAPYHNGALRYFKESGLIK